MAKKVRKTVLNELSRTVPLNNVEFEELSHWSITYFVIIKNILKSHFKFKFLIID